MARKGWRERIEPGIARAHRVACPSTADRRPGRRCRCPYEVRTPGARPGAVTARTVEGTLTDARRARRAAQSGERVEPAARVEAGTLDDLAADYLRTNAARLSPETVRNRDDDYRLRIAPELGRVELADLTRERVEQWLSALALRASSRRMIVQTVATLRVMLAAAVSWGRLVDNPAAGLPLPPEQSDVDDLTERVIDADQLARLLAVAGGGPRMSAKQAAGKTPRVETMLRAAGEVGLRRGEIAGLKWADVDLDARRADIRRSIVTLRREGDRPMSRREAPTKGRRRRRVALSRAMAAALAVWRDQAPAAPGGYVWPGTDGGPMHDRSLGRAVERACHRAGLVDDHGRPLVTTHGLRKTAGSIMLGRGVPLLVVSRQLGHANPNITARIYARLLNADQLDAAAAAFDAPETTGTGEGTGERRESAG